MNTKTLIATAALAASMTSTALSVHATEFGWTVGPMSASGDTICTNGTLVYAYSANWVTVNGVKFERQDNLTNDPSSVSIAFSPALNQWSDWAWGDMGNEGVDDGANGYAYMLSNAWCWDRTATDITVTVTLKGLTTGNDYLVQLVSHKQNGGSDIMISANGTAPKPIGAAGGEGEYRYGASIVGVFTATAETQDVAVTYSGVAGRHPLNAIQVRNLNPVEYRPSISGFDNGSDGIKITIDNAIVGHTYGYKKSTTLEGLKNPDLPIQYMENPVATAGELLFTIARDPNEPTCFYQIVVE